MGIDILAIVGPTASGKTGRAVSIARRLRGEIISGDSRQGVSPYGSWHGKGS